MKKITGFMLGVVFSLCFVSSIAAAESTVLPTKMWTVEFNTPMQSSDINDYVKITNGYGTEMEISFQTEEENLYIHPPASGYPSGEYTLSINVGLSSLQGKKLEKSTSMDFTVVDETKKGEDLLNNVLGALNKETNLLLNELMTTYQFPLTYFNEVQSPVAYEQFQTGFNDISDKYVADHYKEEFKEEYTAYLGLGNHEAFLYELQNENISYPLIVPSANGHDLTINYYVFPSFEGPIAREARTVTISFDETRKGWKISDFSNDAYSGYSSSLSTEYMKDTFELRKKITENDTQYNVHGEYYFYSDFYNEYLSGITYTTYNPEYGYSTLSILTFDEGTTRQLKQIRGKDLNLMD